MPHTHPELFVRYRKERRSEYALKYSHFTIVWPYFCVRVPTVHRTDHDICYYVLRKMIALLEACTILVALCLRPGQLPAACSDLSECDSLSPPP